MCLVPPDPWALSNAAVPCGQLQRRTSMWSVAVPQLHVVSCSAIVPCGQLQCHSSMWSVAVPQFHVVSCSATAPCMCTVSCSGFSQIWLHCYFKGCSAGDEFCGQGLQHCETGFRSESDTPKAKSSPCTYRNENRMTRAGVFVLIMGQNGGSIVGWSVEITNYNYVKSHYFITIYFSKNLSPSPRRHYCSPPPALYPPPEPTTVKRVDYNRPAICSK